MGKSLYTEEQIKFILDAKLTRALEYRQIAKEFQKKWGTERTAEQMRHCFRLNTKGERPAAAAAKAEEEPHRYANFTHGSFGGVVGQFTGTRGRFFVTAASPVTDLSPVMRFGAREFGANLYAPGFRSAQNWIRRWDAQLVVLPMPAHMRALEGQPSYYDPRLESFRDCFFEDYVFNEHLRAVDMHLNPQQLHPLTGLHRIRGDRNAGVVQVGERTIVQRFNQSIIVGHSKQDMEPVATGNGTIARLLHATGAITLPEYRQNRIGRIAKENHVLGGLIVEIDDDKFWIRQVQFHPVDGSFVDWGVKYNPDGSIEEGVRAEGFRPGDGHSGEEDAVAVDAAVEIAHIVQPKKTFVEDVFSGGSVNHHDRNKRLTRALKPKVFKSLDAELTYCREFLGDLFKWMVPPDGEMIVVDSNHHDFLLKWIEPGAYLYEDQNYDLGHRMVVDVLDGRDPLKMRLDPNGKYVWLGSEDDYFVEGCQMASHGHLGADGSRGGASGLEKVHGNAMVGHRHSPGIYGRLFVVGHMSKARHGYNKGPSTWLHCSGVIWSGGQKQLIVSVDGRFRLGDEPTKKEE